MLLGKSGQAKVRCMCFQIFQLEAWLNVHPKWGRANMGVYLNPYDRLTICDPCNTSSLSSS